jgi:selenocysteine lyase/cysteine desulfurase
MLPDYRKYFKLPDDIHYLNCASFSPNLYAVIEAGIKGIEIKSNPHLITGDSFFAESLRLTTVIAQVINASADEIAIMPGVSYGMAIVAKNLARKKGLRSGQEILVVKEEFPSDVLAWEEICEEKKLIVKTVTPPNGLNRGQLWNQLLLDAITEKTCMVVLPNVHWTDGTRFNLEAVRAKTNQVGAWMIVDGSQSIGALAFDVQQIKPDALIAVGYKCLYGPYGLGFGYFGEAFENGVPIELSWINRQNSQHFETLTNYQRSYRKGAYRFNMCEHTNFILLPMLSAAITQLLEWKIATVQAHCGQITKEAVVALRQMGFIIEDEAYRSHHLFGIRLPENVDMENVKATMQRNSISISVRANAIRCSTNLFNTLGDMEALVRTLQSVVKSL